jgi:hypothetical protein
MLICATAVPIWLRGPVAREAIWMTSVSVFTATVILLFASIAVYTVSRFWLPSRDFKSDCSINSKFPWLHRRLT